MALRTLVVMCILLVSCTPRLYRTPRNVTVSPSVGFSGGSGESFHDAVIINGAKSQGEGVAAEYQFISKIFGQRGNGWHLVGQTVIREKNKVVDVIEIQLGQSSERRIYYFDASDFLWRRKK